MGPRPGGQLGFKMSVPARFPLCLALPVLVIAGCSEPPGNLGDVFDTSATGSTSGVTTSGAAGSASQSGTGAGLSGSSGSSSSSGGETTGLKFDTPAGGTMPGTASEGSSGCESIDFLFIIDNSSSMGPHQQSLLASFQPFMDTIAAEVAGSNYRVMALDTDACSGMECEGLPACETTLGAGQVRDCQVPTDTRYLDGSAMTLAEIEAGFTCAAAVGDGGSFEELPMSAMVAAVGPENEPDGCNPAFVRDDAILVVTFVSNDTTVFVGDDDVSTVGSPGEWYDSVVAAKGGNANAVVVLGLVGHTLGNANTYDGAERFVEFVEMFGDRGLVGPVWEDDYSGYFDQAVDLIDTTCDEFRPEG